MTNTKETNWNEKLVDALLRQPNGMIGETSQPRDNHVVYSIHWGRTKRWLEESKASAEMISRKFSLDIMDYLAEYERLYPGRVSYVLFPVGLAELCNLEARTHLEHNYLDRHGINLEDDSFTWKIFVIDEEE